MWAGLIFLAVLAVLGFWAVGIYNNLIRGRRGFENAFAQHGRGLHGQVSRSDRLPRIFRPVRRRCVAVLDAESFTREIGKFVLAARGIE